MGCTCLYKAVLIIVNIVFFILGLVLAVAGCILIWGYSIINSILTGVISSLNSYLSTQGSSLSSEDLITAIMQMLKFAGIPLLVIGAFFLVLSICGMCGACYLCCRPLLIVYMIITGLLSLAQIIITILYFAGGASMDTWAKSMLISTLDGYVDTKVSNIQSVAWFFLDAYMGCCGVNNGTDFDSITTWNRTYSYNNNIYILKYPYSCCKLDTNNFKSMSDTSCVTSGANSTNSNVQTGCYDKLRSLTNQYLTPAIIGIVCLAVFEILLIVCAGMVCCHGNKILPV